MSSRDLVRIGRAGRPHGVRGALTVHVDSEESDVLASVEEIHLEGDAGDIRTFGLLDATRAGTGRWRISLAGIDGRGVASSLTGRTVLVDRAALDLGEEELLVSELPGLAVVCDDNEVGTVSATYHNGVHDVIVIDIGGRCVDFPVTEEHVEGLDGQGRLAIVGFGDFEPLAYASSRDGRR